MSAQSIEDCSFLEIGSIASHFVLQNEIGAPLRLVPH
jgi:hypothetical protein